MLQLWQIQFEQNSTRAESDSERLTEWQDKAMIRPMKNFPTEKSFLKLKPIHTAMVPTVNAKANFLPPNCSTSCPLDKFGLGETLWPSLTPTFSLDRSHFWILIRPHLPATSFNAFNACEDKHKDKDEDKYKDNYFKGVLTWTKMAKWKRVLTFNYISQPLTVLVITPSLHHDHGPNLTDVENSNNDFAPTVKWFNIIQWLFCNHSTMNQHS